MDRIIIDNSENWAGKRGSKFRNEVIKDLLVTMETNSTLPEDIARELVKECTSYNINITFAEAWRFVRDVNK